MEIRIENDFATEGDPHGLTAYGKICLTFSFSIHVLQTHNLNINGRNLQKTFFIPINAFDTFFVVYFLKTILGY